jgi:small nuclear ribonucleoprotein (snRNP)-like protein
VHGVVGCLPARRSTGAGSEFLFAGIPIKLLHEAVSHTISVELKTGEVYRGQLMDAEDNMNLQMQNIQLTGRDGRVTALEHCFIRGSKVPQPSLSFCCSGVGGVGDRDGGARVRPVGGVGPAGREGILHSIPFTISVMPLLCRLRTLGTIAPAHGCGGRSR